MSWWSSNSSFDQLVEKATSESLPKGEQDLGLNLEICDMIRSKTVPAKDAMRTLKRRLLHKNPNVQLATLHLVDVCIKNGGSHFLIEVASREFMDSVVLVLKPNTGAVNPDVRELILQYIQNWASAFKNQLQLSYVEKVYDQLKSEGFQFPSVTALASSFIDSSAPPEWVDSDTCMKCGVPFSFVNRKHHCRNCGGVFDQRHCNNYQPLPQYGINDPVRVCDDCNEKLTKKRGPISNPTPIVPPPSQLSGNPVAYQAARNPAASTPAAAGEDEDADLKRALELSLQESQGTQPPPVTAPQVPETHVDEEEDDDMKAAIAASLRDMGAGAGPTAAAPQSATSGLYQLPPQHQSQSQYQPYQTQPSQGQAAQIPVQPQEQSAPLGEQSTGQSIGPETDEFSAVEEEILYRYVQLVESLQRAPPGAILKETKLQQLNDSVSALRPKLARTLGRTIDKYDTLVDMHGKLTTVVRFYDQKLEERLSQTYGRHNPYGYQAPLAPTATGQAPGVQSNGVAQLSMSTGGSYESGAYGASAPPLAAQGTGQSDAYYPSLHEPQAQQYHQPQEQYASQPGQPSQPGYSPGQGQPDYQGQPGYSQAAYQAYQAPQGHYQGPQGAQGSHPGYQQAQAALPKTEEVLIEL